MTQEDTRVDDQATASTYGLEFNVNWPALVRVNERGRRIIRDYFNALGLPVWAPLEDAEGWSRWQLWSLMEMFGAHMHIGMDPPFDTVIRLLPESPPARDAVARGSTSQQGPSARD